MFQTFTKYAKEIFFFIEYYFIELIFILHVQMILQCIILKGLKKKSFTYRNLSNFNNVIISVFLAKHYPREF